MTPRKAWERVQRGNLDIAFADLIRLAQAFGFRLDRIRGSHHILVHCSLPLLLNLQPEGRRAKRYQVRQLLELIREHGLKIDD